MAHVRFLCFELVILFLRSQVHRFSDDDGLSVVHLHWLSFNPLSFWVILSNFHGSLRGLYLTFSDFLLSLMDTNPHCEVLSLQVGNLRVLFVAFENNGVTTAIQFNANFDISEHEV